MKSHQPWIFGLSLIGVSVALWPGTHATGQDNMPVQIGMMASLFDESDEKTIFAQMKPFVEMVQKQTGQKGEFTLVNTPEKMSEDLKSGKLQMGVVLGLDFGWMRDSCPEAVPLLVAVNETPTVKACILVAKDSPAKTLVDLKGKALALPSRTPRFLKTYFERETKDELGKFAQVKPQSNTDAAIEAVVEREADATLVTSTALEVYKDRKPGRYNRLRILEQSMDFPTGAMIYIPGKVSEESLKRFRDALLTTHKTREGQQTLMLWKLTAFQPPPPEFLKQVDELAKKYPREGK